MPKRFRRYLPAEFGTALPALVGREVHAVLRDDRVLHGRLLEPATGGTLRLEDAKQHRHEVPLDAVAEVISDFVAAY